MYLSGDGNFYATWEENSSFKAYIKVNGIWKPGSIFLKQGTWKSGEMFSKQGNWK